MVLQHMGRAILYPLDQYGSDAFDDLESLNHYHGWVDGCISGDQPSDGFDYGAKLTESVLLGNIAVRYPKTTLAWDEAAMRITNNDQANQWLKRDYRDGWEIEAKS